MSILFDLAFAAIIVINIVVYYKKGFTGTFLSLVSFIIALGLAYVFSGVFAKPVESAGIGDAIVNSYTVSTSRSVMFVIIFIVSLFALKIAESLLTKVINKIPVVGLANKVLGGVMGMVLGFVYSYLAVSLCAIIIVSTNNSLAWLNTGIIDKTFLVSMVYKYNLLALL